MAIGTEPRTRAIGAPTPTQLTAKSEQARRRHERASRRFSYARALSTQDGSLRAKQEFLRRAIGAGLVPAGSVPSIDTIRRLETAWAAGARSIEAYYDEDRPGRPAKVLATALEAEIHRVLFSGEGISAHALTQLLRERAKEIGAQAPSYRQLHRRFARVGRLVRSSARHGSRAGEIDGLPHARVVTHAPHESWALDELTLPIWARVLDWTSGRWISVRLDVVLIVDVFSGVVVGYHIVDPSRRRDEAGGPMRAGFDHTDVLAALLAAGCPELAPDSTREFAGYVPDRLRLDNANAHKTVRALMDRAAVDIDVRPIRKRRAASNGAVERPNAVLKTYCVGIFGHVDDHLPTDQVVSASDVDLALERTKASGYTNGRLSRLVPVQPEALHTVEEIRALFDRIVYRFNYELINRVHGMSRARRYELHRTRRRRQGMDLVRAVEPCVAVVGTSGITHTRNGVSQQFFPVIDGALILLDQAVTYHPDPAGKGIFVEHAGRLTFLRPQTSWSDDEAALIARNVTAITRAISDNAQRLREDAVIGRVGVQGLEAGLEEHARRAASLKRKARPHARRETTDPGSGRQDGGGEPATLAERLAGQVAVNPWANSDPAAFIRPVDNPDEEE